MVYVMNRIRIKDFEAWKKVFDHGSEFRKAGGSLGGQALRNAQDLNEIFVILKWDTLENAKKFGQSEEFRKLLQEAGVMGKPEAFFLEEIEKVQN